MNTLHPITKIVAENLFPYDFYRVYRQTFNTDTYFHIPSSMDEAQKALASLCYDADEWGSSAQLRDTLFVHTTGRGRILKYDLERLYFEVNLDDGSATLAYRLLAALAPLMQPKKWRGGGGNVSFDGKVCRPFKLMVEYVT